MTETTKHWIAHPSHVSSRFAETRIREYGSLWSHIVPCNDGYYGADASYLSMTETVPIFFTLNSSFFTIMFLPLLILTLISAAGLLLFVFKKVNTTILNLLIALGAGSMLAVSLVHIFPEALEQSEYAVYAFLAGFVLIYIIEELLTPHHHDHTHGDHSHEDPHEHYDHVAVVSFIAIFTHTLLDGLGIRAGMGLSEVAGYAILFGVAIHQIPVSLSLAAILRESKLTMNTQITLLALFALAAPTGYILSDLVLSNIDATITGLAAAFAGGSLLYVATTDLIPMIHAQMKQKYLTIPVFILGVLLMSVLASHHHHEHDEHDAGEHQEEENHDEHR